MDTTKTELARVVELLNYSKAKFAALAVAVPGLTTFVVNFIESGKWDENEFRILAATAFMTLIVGSATAAAPAGNAKVEIIPGTSDVETFDELVEDEENEEEVYVANPDGPGTPTDVKP